MTADDIKALVKRLRKHRETGTCLEGTMHLAATAADALESLALENQRLRVDARFTRAQIERIAGACLETPAYNRLMQYIDDEIAKGKS